MDNHGQTSVAPDWCGKAEAPVEGLEYGRILQNQATCVMLLDQEFNVRYLNESAETLLHTSLRRAKGMPLNDLLRDDNQLKMACGKVAAEGGEIRLRNHICVLPSLVIEKRVDCIIKPVEQVQEVLIMLELNELEGLLSIAHDEEIAQRQQSNQAVIRGLAHEIRNPLGGIRGAAQLLAEETASEELREYTQIIIQEADRLTNLVNRMQAQTRAELDHSVNIHSVIEYVRQLVLADGQTKFKIVQDYDPSLPGVRGNRELLVQALINVIGNAAEAVTDMGREGRILLRTRIDHLTLDAIRQQVVRIDVEDNGGGIDPQIQSRIFDPMVTSKPDGTGLGLPISAEIITQHGGALDFKLSPDKTTFRIFLPLYDGSANQKPGEDF